MKKLNSFLEVVYMKRLSIFAVILLSLCSGCSKAQKKIPLDTSFLLLVKSQGRYGYCDRNGTVAIAPKFEGASIFSEGLAAVSQGGKFGYIDVKGTMVIPPSFDAGLIFLDGRAAVKKEIGRAHV